MWSLGTLNSTASSVPHWLFNTTLSRFLVHLQLVPLPSTFFRQNIKKIYFGPKNLQFPDSPRHWCISIMGISEDRQVGAFFTTEVLTCLSSAKLCPHE